MVNDLMAIGGRMPANGDGADRLMGEVADGRAVQQMRTTYATAVSVQQPRSLAKVSRRLLEEATLAGEEFYYGWGAGKDKIEGPSVDLALAAARCWGNCVVELLPVQDMDDCWLFTASFVDLETGFTLQRQFRQSKRWAVHGRFDEARKDDIRFQIGQSKAIRNVVLNAMPAVLVRQAMETAKAGVRSKIEAFVAKHSIAAAADMILKALVKVGVAESRALAKAGVAAKAALNVDHLVTLRGDLHAIESGREYADTLFPDAKDNPAAPPVGRQSVRSMKPAPPADEISPPAPEYDERLAAEQAQAAAEQPERQPGEDEPE